MKRILREKISCSSFVLRVNPTALTKCVNEDSQFSLGKGPHPLWSLISIFYFLSQESQAGSAENEEAARQISVDHQYDYMGD